MCQCLEIVSKTRLVQPLLLLLLLALNYIHVDGEPQVPCLFIFGDSLSDSGNNNNLPTSAKCNYKPYGIDFPIGPTGRFTNGRTVIDIITEFLGFEIFIPPFADTSGSDILKGVNYASGAAGVRIETGKHAGAIISLGLQLINHKFVVSEIANKLGGDDKAKQYLSKCLYYVNIGSNDYINNYFLPELYPTSRIYSPEQYAKVLINELSRNLQALHQVGARKYVLVGLSYMGCTPLSISTRGANGTCVEDENAAAFMFNGNLKTLVDQFNNKFSADSKFIFINSTAGTPLGQSLGFTVTNASCCPTRPDALCAPDETPCQNRKEYIFYDEIHPTQAFNQIIAAESYNSSSNPAFTYPMDIKHLIQA